MSPAAFVRLAWQTVTAPREVAQLLIAARLSHEAILTAMLEHPILVNRPIVCSAKGVRLCRPSEAVLDLLDTLPPGPLAKEDGAPLIDAEGNRLA